MRTISTVPIGPYQMSVVANTYLGDCFLGNGANFERHIVEKWRKVIRPGDTLLDVGAAWGYYTLVANWLTEGRVRVISVEPNPGNVELLAHNIVANHISGALVLSVGAGEIPALLNYQGTFENPIGKVKGNLPGDPVAITPLDSLPIPQPTLVKIDIEGFEPAAIRGMRGLLKGVRYLVTEFCPEALCECGNDPQDYFNLLQSLGFESIELLDTGERITSAPLHRPICDLGLSKGGDS